VSLSRARAGNQGRKRRKNVWRGEVRKERAVAATDCYYGWLLAAAAVSTCESLHARVITRRGCTGRTSFSPDNVTNNLPTWPPLPRDWHCESGESSRERQCRLAARSVSDRRAVVRRDGLRFPRESTAVDHWRSNGRRDELAIISGTSGIVMNTLASATSRQTASRRPSVTTNGDTRRGAARE